jgi:hypothetical protein
VLAAIIKNEVFNNDKNEKMKISDNWKQAIFTLLIGTVVTIGATWFTIYDSDRKAQQAEIERYKNVSDNIVSIVEEHIVNKQTISITELKRLIETQSKTEQLTKLIPIIDILEQAEYNVINSRHLDFRRKSEYKNIINSIYDLNYKEDSLLKKSLLFDSTMNLDKYKEKEHIKTLLITLSNGNEKEINKALFIVFDNYETLLANREKYPGEKLDSQVLNTIIDNKWTFIILFILYIVFAFYFFTYTKIRKRRKVEIHLRTNELLEEREKLIALINEKQFNDNNATELIKRLREIDELIQELRMKNNSR